MKPLTVIESTAHPLHDVPPPRLSAVVPAYNERGNIAELVARLRAALRLCHRPFEILLVDDGSSDGTACAIQQAEAAYAEVRGIYLARNYGQSTAMQAGFDAALGELIVTLDSDLQNDPADIPRLVALLEEQDVDLVSGWRKDRRDPSLRKLFSRIANRLIARLTGVPLHDFGCSLKVYRRDVLERTRLYGEMHRFLPALLSEVGAQVGELVVGHSPRQYGRSKYRLDRTFRVLLDLCLVIFLRKYLQRPLHLFGGTGFACLIPGLSILVYLSGLKLFAGADIGDRPLLTFGTLLVLVGIMLIGQGLLGELISRLLYESGRRPQYHIKRIRKLAASRAKIDF